MTIRKLPALFFCLSLALAILHAAGTSAHELLRDTNGRNGAILHIAPNDDPVAGEISGLDYRLQLKPAVPGGVHLKITKMLGTTETIPVILKNGIVTAEYAFPSRGIYTIELSIAQAAQQPNIFSYDVRVNRGLTGHSQSVSTPIWATLGVIGSVWGMSALTAIAYKYRKRTA